MTKPTDFSLAAVYAAMDAQRCSRGLSWSQVMHEINQQAQRRSIHPISASTVTSMRNKSVAEGDGVLQMLRWLNRTPESFVSDLAAVEKAGARLPEVPTNVPRA